MVSFHGPRAARVSPQTRRAGAPLSRVTVLWLAVTTFSEGLTAVVVLLGAVISALLFRGPLHHPALVAPSLTMLAGYLVLGNPGWNIDTLFASFRAAKELLAVRLHQTVVYVVAAVALSAVAHSVWCMVAALLCSYGSALVHRCIVGSRFLTRNVSRAELRDGFTELREIVRFGLKSNSGSDCLGDQRRSRYLDSWRIRRHSRGRRLE